MRCSKGLCPQVSTYRDRKSHLEIIRTNHCVADAETRKAAEQQLNAAAEADFVSLHISHHDPSFDFNDDSQNT